MTFQESRLETKRALKTFIANKTRENMEAYKTIKALRNELQAIELNNRLNNL